MTALLRPRATYEDLLKVPEKYVGTFTGGDVVRAEPFPEAEIDLASIWGPDEE